jgi:hypothetical protein
MNDRSQPLFHEVQSFRGKRLRILLAMPPVAMLLLLVWQVILGHPWGRQPMSNTGVIFWTVFLGLVYVRLLTVRLVTEVRAKEVLVAMRGFWRKRRIPLAEIASAQAVTYDAAHDWGGYGFRSTRRGTACIARGNRGVRLKLASGSTILIGSERSDELVSVLHRHVPAVSSA